jgi:hypothetical protein
VEQPAQQQPHQRRLLLPRAASEPAVGELLSQRAVAVSRQTAAEVEVRVVRALVCLALICRASRVT